MSHYKITKYYYHYYVLVCLFFLSISAAIYIFKGNFSPTLTVKFVALVIASFFYVLLMLYFLNLKMNQEWVIPRQWRRVQMQPRLHVLVIFPLFIIPLLWLNLAGTLPMLWTYMVGQPQIVETSATAVKKRSRNADFYSFQTVYAGIPIFRITLNEYEAYKNYHLKLKLITRQSHFGTYILSIDEIQITTQNLTNK
ncbi:hypothetical protein [Acinetobacter sp. NIPH 298]|uniref:hypothetical protein n=1 Tax=Acinetobacter sp. NIPH 298 TaxID=1217692 RepID=UPI0002D10EAE|nr:hypothetical protein [Acinetobacter sp. NIPH 298]ENW97552.1 hypothetical protein F903_00068 [Acinetobacter sp. NIPH 298]